MNGFIDIRSEREFNLEADILLLTLERDVKLNKIEELLEDENNYYY